MRDLLGAYARAADRFDEMLGADGRPRPHWAALVDLLAGAEPARMRERIVAIEREIRDSGLTYNLYADPKGAGRAWPLDALPMIVDAAEWSAIEAAVAQRARLLDAVLGDLYGPQRLLAEGLLPPRLVFGHSQFQRAACASAPPDRPSLVVYAADLARSPDGRWWVVADRTQAPSGAGYAIENRLIVSRIFPELFRRLHAHRLAGFFGALRDALRAFAPEGDGPSLAVLLTPGPYNETYSEHSLLARYLGLTLAEGSDLTVRDGKVWLKTVAGLRRVHAILRRQDDEFCDPLELRSDSALGVPGLTDCARRGSVLVANAIGSGVLESGAMLGYLPGLARRLLGEPLAMPSVATWWLGEPAAFEEATARVADLVFKPADPRLREEPVFGQDLDAAGTRAFVARLRRHPEAWIAQERVSLSQAPVYDRQRAPHLGARAIGLRVFAVASRDGWQVMPGGLTRVAGQGDDRVISMQRGGASKDTWVLSTAPVTGSPTLLSATVTPDALVRSGAGNLASRAAENLFWLGRYSERAEDAARLLRVALPRFAVDEETDRPAHAPILALARASGVIAPTDEAAPAAALLAAVYEGERLGGLRTTLQQVQRTAFGLRERLSIDHWRTITRLLNDAGFDGYRELPQAIALLDRVVNGMVTLSGFALDGMTRDTGWRFLSIGRRIERLRALCAALSSAILDGRDAGLDWLLEFCDSTLTYRSRYLGSPEWLPVLDLLIRDETNPRSIAFQTKGLSSMLQRIDRELGGGAGADLLPAVLRESGPLSDPARLGPREEVAGHLAAIAAGAAGLSDRLSMRFFVHADDRRRVTLAA